MDDTVIDLCENAFESQCEASVDKLFQSSVFRAQKAKKPNYSSLNPVLVMFSVRKVSQSTKCFSFLKLNS